MPGKVISIPLDADQRNDVASLVYSAWCKSFDAMKAAKGATWESSGKFCPKGEWPNYHKVQIEHAQKELDKLENLRNAVCPFSPIVFGE